MKKSIETIWKEGFSESDTLLAPKLTNLYTKKSIHFIDRFIRLFRINLIAIAAFAFVLLIASFIVGIPLVGGVLFSLFMYLSVVGKMEIDKLKKIDKNQDSFHYLFEFNSWLKGVMNLYYRVYKFFYPLLFLSLLAAIWRTGLGEKIVNKAIIVWFPDLFLYNGFPLLWLVPLLLIPILLFIFGGDIYRIDMKLTYGNALRKLEEMLKDIEELRG